MDDKVFSLLEKLYIEFTEFKTETNNRFDKLDGRIDRIEGRLDRIEDRLDRIEDRLDKVESRLDKVEVRLDKVEGRLDKIEVRLDKLELGQEKLDDKVSEAFEAIESLVQVNEVQHKEILSELKGDIRVIELAVKKKNYSKDKIK